MLTVDRIKELLDYYPEAGVLVWKVSTKGRKAGRLAGGKNNTTGYLSVSVDGHSYPYAHLVWFYIYGRWPKEFIDHINLDVFDNRISNIRECNRSQNNANRRIRSDSKTGIKGVTKINRSKPSGQCSCNLGFY